MMADAIHGVTDASWASKPRSTSQTPIEVAPQERFLSALHRRSGGDERADRARKAAEEFVATTLVKPILTQMREMNQAAPPFAPGPYEKAFSQMIDDEIATRLVKAQRFALVDRLKNQMMQAGGSSFGAVA